MPKPADARRVLAAAAQPLDLLLGAAGTLAGHVARGDDVCILLAMADELGQVGVDINAAQREDVGAVFESMGLPAPLWIPPPHARVDADPESLHLDLAAVWERNRPQLVYVPAAEGLPENGEAILTAARMLAHPDGSRCVERLLAFEVWEDRLTAPHFQPNVFVDIAGVLDRKLDALSRLKTLPSVLDRDVAAPRARSTALAWGAACGLSAAEAFVLLKENLTT